MFLSVSLKSGNMLKDLQTLMNSADKKKFDGSTIIYCPVKKLTSKVCDELRKLGIRCDEYHANLKLEVRKEAQRRFMADEISVSVFKRLFYINFLPILLF